jgi:hypothetical protein
VVWSMRLEVCKVTYQFPFGEPRQTLHTRSRQRAAAAAAVVAVAAAAAAHSGCPPLTCARASLRGADGTYLQRRPRSPEGVWGLGFGVWGLGFGVWGLGFGV